jgi:guanylate kinase
MSEYKKLIVLSSPSGGGKSTLARHLSNIYPGLKFSVSATTRQKRQGERNGRDYFFVSKDAFDRKIENDELVEYEEIFGNFYGTLKSEIEKSISEEKTMLFDVDVKGAISLEKAFPTDTISIFIYPPSMQELENRLRDRSTESEDEITKRLARSEEEFSYKDQFDYTVLNDILEDALSDIEKIAEKHIDKKLMNKNNGEKAKWNHEN